MEATTIMRADYLDILFENRNKSFGGYELRKHYDRRVKKAFAILTLFVSGLVCVSFINTGHEEHRRSNAPIRPTIVEIKPVVKPPIKVIQDIAPPPAAKNVKTVVYTPPVVRPDDDVPDDKVMEQNKQLINVHQGPSNADGDTADIGIVSKTGTGTGAVTFPKKAEPMVYVQQMPQFDGNMEVYINSHLSYPEGARESKIEGKVLIRFVVNEDGSVSDVTVARGIGGGCDQEAQRMVSGMPKWKSGKQNGIPVKVFFTLPIQFVLQ
jgi:periplasmic protein TonB